MSMEPEVVVVVVVDASQLMIAMTVVVVVVVVAGDMVAAVLDAALNDHSSCGLFHVRGEAQNCHLDDCESYRDDDIVAVRADYDNDGVGGGGVVVVVGIDDDDGGCRNDWILVQTIYYYCVYYYLMHAPMHSEWKCWVC